ncbi:alanine racemase [Legionella qingyii]|uniref:Alanine racemase n=1 Tax=Legionella qingyii TaxID=2184757 RepID=A0A317U9N4_9GAMM|nr:alanine racemase [Legionella qingyii]PWY57417.1 alanine racemase [Legionella qingyii]RUR26500.1 alanine racemase [Legionella qingyii]RUR27520.1 alanine racemase [Legionella qingyii]
MSRPTRLVIEPNALHHNLARIRRLAPGKKIIAMVKANAYGCGVHVVAPILEGHVDAFGVACIEEALVLRKIGIRTHCILFQGVFSPDEFKVVAQHQFGCVIHQPHQVQWLLNTPLDRPIKLWVKVNTGMHRLGFKTHELQGVMDALQSCPWVDKEIGLMTHLACADEPERIENSQQIALFESISVAGFSQRSIANSAAIISFPQTHADVVRPGIMLYGVSPFTNQTAIDLGLLPVMRFVSAISAVYHNPPLAQVGYGGIWKSEKPSIIGIVAAGYGDGYPRHIAANTPVWVQGKEVPIVGRVSMDMLAVDLTDHSEVKPGAPVELWGTHILVERVAKAAGTSGYELLCQISERVRHD